MVERIRINIPHRTVHSVLKDDWMAGDQSKRGKRRWLRREREYSNSMWHTGWKQIHGGTHDGRWFLCYEDDASRFVTGYGVFDNATAENALKVLDEAIRNHGRPASIMTDRGNQFHANEENGAKTGHGRFEESLVALGIRQVLAGPGRRQTSGKAKRLYGEIQRKLYEFEDIMMRKSDPVDLFMRWYNYDRPHMSLDRKRQETPAQAFERKMPPSGKTVTDETGEGHHAR